MKSNLVVNLTLVFIFLTCLFIGNQLSLRKAFWKDELHTQVRTVEGFSVWQILRGEVIEGCNSPLYYLIQKFIVEVAQYKLPFVWENWKDGGIYHPPSQVLLRLSSNICISLAVTLIFRYFWLNFSIATAFLSLLTALSSHMLLVYWAEARPYALWFLLSVVQLILLFRLIRSSRDKFWPLLMIVHVLLALTTVVSIGQVFTIPLILFLFGKGGGRVLKNFSLIFIPFIIYSYYLWTASARVEYYPYRVSDPLALIFEAFSSDRVLLILVLVFIYLGCRYIGKRSIAIALFQGWLKSFCCYVTLLFIFAVSLLAYFKFKETPDLAMTGLNSRYLMFLVPVEIFCTTYGVVAIFRFLRDNHVGWWVGQFVLMVGFFYIIHFLLLYKQIYSVALFGYN